MFVWSFLFSHESIKSFLNKPLWPIANTRTITINPSQSGPGNHDNDGASIFPVFQEQGRIDMEVEI